MLARLADARGVLVGDVHHSHRTSNCRANSIMSTIVSAMFTLLDSSDAGCELARSASACDLRAVGDLRTRPSAALASCAGRIHELQPADLREVSGPCPCGTIEIVPSPPIDS